MVNSNDNVSGKKLDNEALKNSRRGGGGGGMVLQHSGRIFQSTAGEMLQSHRKATNSIKVNRRQQRRQEEPKLQVKASRA